MATYNGGKKLDKFKIHIFFFLWEIVFNVNKAIWLVSQYLVVCVLIVTIIQLIGFICKSCPTLKAISYNNTINYVF